jgi:hypothetical protein
MIATKTRVLDEGRMLRHRLLFFLVALFVCGEYYLSIMYAALQLPSSRGGRSYEEASILLEKEMNHTISLIANVTEERLMSLENRLSSIERVQQTKQTESHMILERKTNDTIPSLGTKDSEQRLLTLYRRLLATEKVLTKREENGDRHENDSEERLVALEKRLSSTEKDLTKYTQRDLHKRLSNVEERIQKLEHAPIANGHEDEFPYGSSSNETFCVPWEESTDSWWTHNVDWYISLENDTHYCFSLMEDEEKAATFRKLYEIQFKGDCSNVTTKRMWSNGYGADFQNIIDGLNYALQTNSPMQVHNTGGPWHYTVKRDGSGPVCPSEDMYCYFLNLTRCEPVPERVYEGDFMTENYSVEWANGHWFQEYATRQQTWLRHEAYKFSKKVNVVTPCSVMHVRRSDIVLHDEISRRYREIGEYVRALKKRTKNILLFTDDHNAIGEALTNFPQYNWMYIDRKRHKGAEGGWENQLPSDDPKSEMVVLQSIFRLARKCTRLVRTTGNFGNLIEAEMRDALRGKGRLKLVNLDHNDPFVFSPNNTLSVNISKSFA